MAVLDLAIRRLTFTALAVLLAACGQSAPTAGPTPGEWHIFSADGSATGERRTLQIGSTNSASIFRLSGTLLETGDRALGIGFRAEAIGFSEEDTGMVGTSVWTDDTGDQIFSSLKGEAIGTNTRVVGTFTGGSGRYAGAAGEYEFQWQYVVSAEQGHVSGRTVGLKGRIRVGNAVSPGGKADP